MLTTAGSTRFTSGAKLCWGNNPVAGAAASLEAGGFWAHTNGDSASVAPRPNPRAAARVFLNQARRRGPAGRSVMNNLLLRGWLAATWGGQGDRSLSDGL